MGLLILKPVYNNYLHRFDNYMEFCKRESIKRWGWPKIYFELSELVGDYLNSAMFLINTYIQFWFSLHYSCEDDAARRERVKHVYDHRQTIVFINIIITG